MTATLQAKNWKTRVKVHLLDLELSITDHLAHEIEYPRNSVSIAINTENRLPGVKKAINSYLKINAHNGK